MHSPTFGVHWIAEFASLISSGICLSLPCILSTFKGWRTPKFLSLILVFLFHNFVVPVKQKLGSAEAIVGTQDLELKKQTLRYRRCVLLAVVGGTPIEYPSLARIVADGYLNSVKLWLDEILATPEGTESHNSVTATQ